MLRCWAHVVSSLVIILESVVFKHLDLKQTSVGHTYKYLSRYRIRNGDPAEADSRFYACYLLVRNNGLIIAFALCLYNTTL